MSNSSMSAFFKNLNCLKDSDWLEWQRDEKKRIRILDLIESVRRTTLRKPGSNGKTIVATTQDDNTSRRRRRRVRSGSLKTPSNPFFDVPKNPPSKRMSPSRGSSTLERVLTKVPPDYLFTRRLVSDEIRPKSTIGFLDSSSGEKCFSSGDSDCSISTAVQRTSVSSRPLSRPISAYEPNLVSTGCEDVGCRFGRKFWRQDIKPASHFTQGHSLRYLAKKDSSHFGRSLASGSHLSKSFPHELSLKPDSSQEFQKNPQNRNIHQKLRDESMTRISRSRPDVTSQVRSPIKTGGHNYVKAVRRKPNIKPASHFTERRNEIHVQPQQFIVPRVRTSHGTLLCPSRLSSQFSKSISFPHDLTGKRIESISTSNLSKPPTGSTSSPQKPQTGLTTNKPTVNSMSTPSKLSIGSSTNLAKPVTGSTLAPNSNPNRVPAGPSLSPSRGPTGTSLSPSRGPIGTSLSPSRVPTGSSSNLPKSDANLSKPVTSPSSSSSNGEVNSQTLIKQSGDTQTIRLDGALSKLLSGASDFSVVIPPRTSFRLRSVVAAGAAGAAGSAGAAGNRNSTHLTDIKFENIITKNATLNKNNTCENKSNPNSNSDTTDSKTPNPKKENSESVEQTNKLELSDKEKSTTIPISTIPNKDKPELSKADQISSQEAEKSSKLILKTSISNLNLSNHRMREIEITPNFDLGQKVSFKFTSINGLSPSQKINCIQSPMKLGDETKAFTVDAVDTFIDADSPIDYGSLATTQPIDVDEALGALDSMKFKKPTATNEKVSSDIELKKLWTNLKNTSSQDKNKLKTNVWQLSSYTKTDNANIPEVNQSKPKSDEDNQSNNGSTSGSEAESSVKDDDTSVANLEVVIKDQQDNLSQPDGEWESGWTTPLTACTSSEGNFDEEGFKTATSGDSEDELTWGADHNSMEWSSVNQNGGAAATTHKIKGTLKTVWADEDYESPLRGTTPVTARHSSFLASKTSGWLARSLLIGTEDLYCDDELHPSLENAPNMQLSVAQQASEAVKPYPPMPMLTDRDSILSFDESSTGPTSLRSELSEDRGPSYPSSATNSEN